MPFQRLFNALFSIESPPFGVFCFAVELPTDIESPI